MSRGVKFNRWDDPYISVSLAVIDTQITTLLYDGSQTYLVSIKNLTGDIHFGNLMATLASQITDDLVQNTKILRA